MTNETSRPQILAYIYHDETLPYGGDVTLYGRDYLSLVALFAATTPVDHSATADTDYMNGKAIYTELSGRHGVNLSYNAFAAIRDTLTAEFDLTVMN